MKSYFIDNTIAPPPNFLNHLIVFLFKILKVSKYSIIFGVVYILRYFALVVIVGFLKHQLYPDKFIMTLSIKASIIDIWINMFIRVGWSNILIYFV